MAALDQLTGLMNLISGIQGGGQTTTSSGGSQTTQTNLSDAAVQEQIRKILSGSGGVRDIGGSARRSGLYNSTSEDLLLGNLYATAANQGEIARAPTVTTTTPQTQTTTTEGAGLGTTLGVLGGAAALNAILNSNAAKSAGNGLLDLVGLGGDTGTGAPISGIDGSVSGGLSIAPGGTGFQLGGSLVDGNGAQTGFSGDSFSAQQSLGLPGIGGTTSGASGQYNSNDDFDLLGSIGNAVSGFFSGGGLGGLVGAVQGGFGGGSSGGGGTSGGSIICTALMSRGLLDADHYAKGEAYISKVPMEVKVGYYSWAAPIARKIREGDKFWTAVCLPFARGRTALLATDGTFADHCKNPLGTLTKFIGEPICGWIGNRILRKTLASTN